MASLFHRAGLLGLVVLVAGCAAPPTKPEASPDASPELYAGPGRGAIEGVARDAAGLPIAGARVGLVNLGLEDTTNAAGRFAFSDLPVGVHRLATAKLGYASFALDVEVRPGQAAVVDLVLEPVPLGVPVVESVDETGFLQCSVGALYAANACDAVLGATEDRVRLDVDESLPLMQLVVTLTWDAVSPATGQELGLSLCLPQEGPSQAALPCAADDLSEAFVAHASGTSPVVLDLSAAQLPLADHKVFEAWVAAAPDAKAPAVQQPFVLHGTLCYVASCAG